MVSRRTTVLLLYCLVAIPALAQDNWATFGNRDIDKLPKSHHAEPEDARDWDEPDPPEDFELTLHLKGLFRVGEDRMERLVVIEARRPDDNEGPLELVLAGHDGRPAWRETVEWVGTDQRMRPYWLPFPLGPSGPLLLVRGDRRLAEVAAPLTRDAPKLLFGSWQAQTIPATDAEYALLSATEAVVEPGAEIAIPFATRTIYETAPEVGVWTSSPGDEGDAVLIRQPDGSTNPMRGEAQVTAPEEPGDYSIRAEVTLGDGSVIEERYTVHVRERPEVEFGARYADLGFTQPVTVGDSERPWDELWVGSEKRDVVVSFPEGPGRFVFWRGANYVGCWALPEAWLTYEWLEAEPDFYGAVGCVEPLQDKECERSQVEIIESSPARVVVSWKYDLVDAEVKVIRDEHAEEIFTFYPDGSGTRYLRGFYESGWHETQEFIVVNRPGRTPSQALQPQAVTFLSPGGERQDPVWPKPGFSVAGWPQVISIVNLRGGLRPFMATPEAPYQTKVWADPYVDKPELFNCYPHWPVTRGMKTSWLEDPADFRRPTHTNLVNLVSDPIEQTAEEKDFLWLIGLAREDDDALAATRCWLKPGEIVGDGVEEWEYSPRERAYAVRPSSEDECELTLVPQAGTPVVNPAFLIEGWAANCTASIEGAADVRVGQGRDGCVVWVRGEFGKRTTVRLTRIPIP